MERACLNSAAASLLFYRWFHNHLDGTDPSKANHLMDALQAKKGQKVNYERAKEKKNKCFCFLTVFILL